MGVVCVYGWVVCVCVRIVGLYGWVVGINVYWNSIYINLYVRLGESLHPPGIEPGARAWKARMLPLHQGCALFHYIDQMSK